MQEYMSLEIEAHIDGADRVGRFEFGPAQEGRLTVSEGVRTGYLLQGSLSQLSALITDFIDEDEADRKGFYVDLGGGQHTFDIRFESPKDSEKPGGGLYQWGTTADDSVLEPHSATGAGRITQLQVFSNFVRRGKTDSFTPGRFQFGQYHESGILEDEIAVGIESPSGRLVNDGSSRFEGSMTLIELRTLREPVEANFDDTR